jgi:hypothetical protein
MDTYGPAFIGEQRSIPTATTVGFARPHEPMTLITGIADFFSDYETFGVDLYTPFRSVPPTFLCPDACEPARLYL